jgi:hypothetical protein
MMPGHPANEWVEELNLDSHEFTEDSKAVNEFPPLLVCPTPLRSELAMFAGATANDLTSASCARTLFRLSASLP